MMATMLAGIAQFERDLLSERVKSVLAAARARGKKLGRQPGQRPKSDKLAPKVIQAVGLSQQRNAKSHRIGKASAFNICLCEMVVQNETRVQKAVLLMFGRALWPCP